jgi:hypothetical protein
VAVLPKCFGSRLIYLVGKIASNVQSATNHFDRFAKNSQFAQFDLWKKKKGDDLVKLNL